ncbi:hypothetical protein ABGB17_10680 [Sphaerisporangium sp. B11E5]|uniref:hypothetical protein n=1 Tax=Sphaerisporangium sp. B11E5 TaxID=3153563 RepID=UPI00325D621B
MTGLPMDGMAQARAEAHRRALGELCKHLESHGLRCRAVERIHLSMRGGPCHANLGPPEMDVYGDGRLIVVVTVVGSPQRGLWYLVKRPDGLPVRTSPAGDPVSAARDIAARWDGTSC